MSHANAGKRKSDAVLLMRSETQRSPVLLNAEVAALLRERGAASTDQFSRATATEKASLEYLTSVYPACSAPPPPVATIAAFRASAAAMGFMSAEVAQMINMRPSSAVDVHLIVEDLDSRFGERADEIVENVLALVETHFPVIAEAPAAAQ